MRLRRTMLGMSQDQIGSATGITFQQVQKYERGVNRMGSSRLYEFSRILSVPVAYFFEGFLEGRSPKAAGMAESAAPAYEHEVLGSKETMSLVKSFNEITNPKTRKHVLQLVKSIAQSEGDSDD